MPHPPKRAAMILPRLLSLLLAGALAACGVASPGGAPAGNADLSGLLISTGVLSPAFDPAVTRYTVGPGLLEQQVRVTPTVADPGATVTVEGIPLTSGSRSSPASLPLGTTTVSVVVTAPDGATKRTTTIDFSRSGLAWIQTVALQGEPATQGVRQQYTGFASVRINNRGQVLFKAGYAPARGGGVFVHDAGVTRTVMYTGQVAPKTGGAVINRIFGLGFSDNGQAAVVGWFQGAGIAWPNNQAIYAADPDTGLREVVRAGGSAPGAPGMVFHDFRGDPTINRSGLVAFQAGLCDETGCQAIGEGFGGTASEVPTYKEGIGGLQLVAREGDPTPAGGTFNWVVGEPTINDLGQVAFGASTSRSPVHGDSLRDNAIFTDRAFPFSGLDAAVIAGQLAPGSGGLEFRRLHLVDPIGFNNRGYVAFSALLSDVGSRGGGRTKAVYKTRPGIPSISDPFPDPQRVPIAIGGQPAPGTGRTFSDLTTHNLHNVGLNNPGRVAFKARLDNRREGIWAEARGEPLSPVVLGGEVLEVRPGDFRTIDTAVFSIDFGGDGAFNDLGQVAFLATFTDGTEGVFRTVVPGLSIEYPIVFFLDPNSGDVNPSASIAVGAAGFGTELPVFVKLPVAGQIPLHVAEDEPAFASFLLTPADPQLNQNQKFTLTVDQTTIEGEIGKTLSFEQLGLNGVRSFTIALPESEPTGQAAFDGEQLFAGLTFVSGGTDVTVSLSLE